MTILPFEERDPWPLAARRAWRALGYESPPTSAPSSLRESLSSLGTASELDLAAIQALIGEELLAGKGAPLSEPDGRSLPVELLHALGARPLTVSTWQALAPIARYGLWELARTDDPRLSGAYEYWVGAGGVSSHLSPTQGARMVDVGDKEETKRRAEVETFVSMSAEAFSALSRNVGPKGEILGVARVAAILAAKNTAQWIPLCHPLPLTRIDVEFHLEEGRLRIWVAVETRGRTGVEMEALTAASAAGLTVYDMLKGLDRSMELGPTRLVAKSGGRSGDYTRE